jgi:hypothetical protein
MLLRQHVRARLVGLHGQLASPRLAKPGLPAAESSFGCLCWRHNSRKRKNRDWKQTNQTVCFDAPPSKARQSETSKRAQTCSNRYIELEIWNPTTLQAQHIRKEKLDDNTKCHKDEISLRRYLLLCSTLRLSEHEEVRHPVGHQ